MFVLETQHYKKAHAQFKASLKNCQHSSMYPNDLRFVVSNGFHIHNISIVVTVYSLTNALSDTIFHTAGSYYTVRKSWRRLSVNEEAPGAYPITNTHLDCIQAEITPPTHIGDPFHYSYLACRLPNLSQSTNIHTIPQGCAIAGQCMTELPVLKSTLINFQFF